MNEFVSYIMGFGICCMIPLIMFFVGVYYARYGLPMSIRWKGLFRHDDLEEEE